MKTILLRDPNRPGALPRPFTLSDSLASILVRAGVASAANPADQAGLAAGAAVDPFPIVSIMLHGSGDGPARVSIPLAAAQAAYASTSETVGKGGIAPGTADPVQVPVIAPPAASIADPTPGATIALIEAQERPVFSPNDGRVLVMGAPGRWRLAWGNRRAFTGSIAGTIFGDGGQASPIAISVTASGVTPPPVPTPAFVLSQLPPGALKLDVDPAAMTAVGGVVPSFTDATGAFSFAATGAAQPAYLATYGAAAKPALLFDGADDIMSAAGALPATCWIFAVVERRASNNVSTSDGRTIFEYPRAGDNLRHSFGTVRTTTDSAQTLLRRSSAGAALSSAANNNFAIDGVMHVIEVQNDALGGASLGNDGAEYGARIGTTGATTASGLNIGGSTVNSVDRQGMVLMRLIAVDHSLIPGGRRNLYVKKLIGAHLQWLYGIQAALPAMSPFKTRAPLASDLKAFSLVVQTWGNSIADQVNPFVIAALGYANSTSVAQNAFGAKGVAFARSDVGQSTFTQINARMTTGKNSGTSTDDGTPLGQQNKGVVLSGELYQNGVDSPVSLAVDWATMATLMDERMTFVANEQGLSVAASRHGIWTPWISWGDQSALGTEGRAARDSETARLKSTYAANVIRHPTTGMTPTEYACSLSAPGSQYADPAQFARGQPPVTLDREYDAATGVGTGVHPNDTLCDLIAKNVILPWLQSKGWVV